MSSHSNRGLSSPESAVLFIKSQTVVSSVPVHTITDNSFHTDLRAPCRNGVLGYYPDRPGPVINFIRAPADARAGYIYTIAVTHCSRDRDFLVLISGRICFDIADADAVRTCCGEQTDNHYQTRKKH